MALIPQERPKQIALVVGLAALAGVYAFYAYWYTPRMITIGESETRLSLLQDQNRQAQVIAARGGADLEEALATYERHVARLEELIPASDEVPALLSSLTMEARLNDTELVLLNPGLTETSEFYTRRTYDLEVVGEFHDVGRFLTAIGSLARIVTPINVEVEPWVGETPYQDMESPVTVRFQIETYVLPEPSDPAAAPPAPAGGPQG